MLFLHRLLSTFRKLLLQLRFHRKSPTVPGNCNLPEQRFLRFEHRFLLLLNLQDRELRFRIIGETMRSWKVGMPSGMKLKSHAWASDLYDPAGEFQLRAYCAGSGVELKTSDTPTLDQFVAYAEAFQLRFAPIPVLVDRPRLLPAVMVPVAHQIEDERFVGRVGRVAADVTIREDVAPVAGHDARRR